MGAVKSQEHPSGDDPSPRILRKPSTLTQACTHRLLHGHHTASRKCSQNPARMGRGKTPARSQDDQQDSKSSQYEQHSQRGSVMGNHYDLKQQTALRRKKMRGYARKSRHTHQTTCTQVPNQQIRPTAEEQLQCLRKTVSEKSKRVDKTDGYEDIGPKYGTFNFMHASNSQHTAKNKTLISKLKMQQSSDRTHQLKDKRSPGSRYNTCE